MKEWKKKKEVKEHYNQIAEIYQIQYKEEQNLKINEILKELKINQNDLLLDLGCGTGFLLPKIKKPCYFIGLDMSRNSLLHAKKQKRKMMKFELICADADNTPFPDNVFDKIFAITLIQNIPKFKKTINEIKRISKPNAIIVITGLKKSFNLQSLVNLLDKTKLRIIKTINNEKLKDFLVICNKR